MSRAYSDWLDLTADSWRLAFESSAVIILRIAKLAAADAPAMREAQLMVAEKVFAAAEAQRRIITSALTGRAHLGPRDAVALYRRKVRRNLRRLGRK